MNHFNFLCSKIFVFLYYIFRHSTQSCTDDHFPCLCCSSRNWLFHVNIRPCYWLCVGRTAVNHVHWCWFGTKARQYLFLFYFSLFHFNNINIIDRTFLSYFPNIAGGNLQETKPNTNNFYIIFWLCYFMNFYHTIS